MRKIGKYEVLGDPVASGAQGLVCKVRHEDTGEVFAMKIFKRQRNDEKNVEREIMNHEHLRHPNVIKFREVISHKHILAIVMELAGGVDLETYLTYNGAFGESKAKIMFHELIEGVSYIHSKRISHRDLKAENILMTSDGNSLKICDFGLSKSSVLHSKATSSIGTRGYMAPEVESHSEHYNGKVADVWSCGGILHYMLTLEFPILQNDTVQSRWLDKYHVSEDCRTLIRGMLVTDPDKRITIEEIKEHPWYLKEEVKADYLSNKNKTAKIEDYKILTWVGKGPQEVVYKECDRQAGEPYQYQANEVDNYGGTSSHFQGFSSRELHRIAFITKSETEDLDDGFKWRKYGKKTMKNSPYQRSYYKCLADRCPVKKTIERDRDDPKYVIFTYEGFHSHPTPF